MILIELLVIFTITWTLLFIRPAPLVWSLIMGFLLLLATSYGYMHVVLMTLLWLLYILLAVFANVAPLRKMLFSAPFLRRFREILPPMSSTEREALEAGDVWWEGDLFAGRPNWSKLHAIPKPRLTQEEQKFVDHETEILCGMLDDWKIMYQDHDLSKETWDYLKNQGFFGLVIDKKYGGKGFSALAHSTIVSKIATRSMSAAVTTMVPNSLGPGELLSHYGTDEQKNYYLPRLAKGEEIPCFALTSTLAGSDAGAMQDHGIVCKGMYEGKEIIGIKVTWDKRYITLAPIATVLGLAFKLYDPDHLLGNKENVGITLCLLPTKHPGVNIGQRHFPMGTAFMNGSTSGKDVFIPLDWIIGGSKMAGKGWRMLMECLSIGRAISLPGLGAAVGRLTYFSTGIYAHLRRQFKVPLSNFEGVQEKMAQIAGNTYLLEASRRMTAGAVDLKVKPSVVSAIQKYHATELARVMSDAAMDIHAGRAIQLGPRNYLSQAYISMPISITVEGANILTRNLIIFGQGAIRCHPYVFQEMLAASDSDQQRALRKFDRLLLSHIGYAASNVVRAISFGVTNAWFVLTPKQKPLVYYYRQLTRMSTALALVSDFAMLTLGGELKRKERLSARLGDVLSYLYLGSATLKYYADENYPDADLPYVQWCLETMLAKIQIAFDDFLRNFPQRIIAHVLRFIIFPFGRSYHGPSDALENQLVLMMTQSSELRKRLCSYVHVPQSATDNLGRLAAAYTAVNQVKEIDNKIKQAIAMKKIVADGNAQQQLTAAISGNVVTEQEGAQWLHAQHLIADAMEVDAFNPNYFVKETV